MSRFSVPEMSCGHCRATIKTAFAEADAAAELRFDMTAREIDVDSVLKPAEVIATLKQAGYDASEIG